MKIKTVYRILAADCWFWRMPVDAAAAPVMQEPAKVSTAPVAAPRFGTGTPVFGRTVGVGCGTVGYLVVGKYEQLSETSPASQKNMQLLRKYEAEKRGRRLQRRLAQTQKELDEASEFLQKCMWN